MERKRKREAREDLVQTQKQDQKEKKKKQLLEQALKHKEQTGASLRATAKLFGVDRRTLKAFQEGRYHVIGRPPLLSNEGIEDLKTYLTSLDGCQIQQSLGDVKVVLQKMAATPQKCDDKTARKYVKKAGLQIRKARSADEGRVRVI